jgi:hypothetical protein
VDGSLSRAFGHSFVREQKKMTKKSMNKNLVEVKKALADKYERLANKRCSKPARARLLRHAERFRCQAENLSQGSSK